MLNRKWVSLLWRGIKIMAYFPFFVDLSNKRALIVGGGNVALRKIQKIKPFNPSITVISPLFNKEIIDDPSLNLIKREYKSGDEKSYSFVIAATNNRKINKEISQRCKDENILVNVVDDPSLCSFIFPSLIKNGKLTIGISTSGSSPTAAITLKEKIQDMIPSNFDAILDYLYKTREEIKENVKTEEERHLILKALFTASLEKGDVLLKEETQSIIGGLINE